ncbi:MAG: hypothetical protein CL521_00120 [Actinobacteria bacterium]|nr:hypothetical protein [Actinomycetota bacterium]
MKIRSITRLLRAIPDPERRQTQLDAMLVKSVDLPLDWSLFFALVEAGANVNCCYEEKTLSYKTPFLKVIETGHLPLVQICIAHGAVLNGLVHEYADSPVFVAAKHDHADVLTYLLEQRCDPSVTKNELSGPVNALHIAVRNDAFDAVSVLLDHGLDVNQQYQNGRGLSYSPLHFVCSAKMVRFLVDNYDASVDLDSEYGTAIHTVIGWHGDVFNELLLQGADPHYSCNGVTVATKLQWKLLDLYPKIDKILKENPLSSHSENNLRNHFKQYSRYEQQLRFLAAREVKPESDLKLVGRYVDNECYNQVCAE